jgi:DNA-binding CsgD family transcriptional regulator
MMTDRDAAEGAMARSAEPIVVSAVEREELDRLVRGHSTPQQLALRARIILLAAEGIGNRESARRLGVTVQTVRCWRRRWDGEPDLALAGRCAASGDAADIHRGTDLRHRSPGLRTAGRQRGADHALEPECAGPRSDQAGPGRDDLPRLDRAFFKGRLISSPIACVPG